MEIKTILTLLGWMMIISSSAQLQLPPFDIELKVNENIIPGNGENGEMEFFETTNLHGAIHFQIGQHLGIGGYYAKSFRGMTKYHDDLTSVSNTMPAEFLAKGISIRLSTGRSKNWRKFITLNYSKLDIVEEDIDFRFAAKSNAIGGSVGLMRKLGNNLYITVLEIGVKSISDQPFWFGASSNTLLDAKMGLLYNFSRRK